VAPTPPEDLPLGAALAQAAEAAGVRKARAPRLRLLVLGVLAGAFIALGSAFSSVAVTGAAAAWPHGAVRVAAGLTFCLGLVLVLATGAELFTGNVLLVMAWTRRRLSTREVLACWGWVLLGNAVGAVGTAALLLGAGVHEQGGGAVGRTVLAAAQAKCLLDPLQAFVLGVACNGLVCLAVWCALGARSLGERVAAVIFPVTAFVALGLEHSVANLFLLPWGLLVQAADPAQAQAVLGASDALRPLDALCKNLVPVTLGNVVGGSLLVALPYALAYRPLPPPSPPEA
jgi:formate/nitrite transporter